MNECLRRGCPVSTVAGTTRRSRSTRPGHTTHPSFIATRWRLAPPTPECSSLESIRVRGWAGRGPSALRAPTRRKKTRWPREDAEGIDDDADVRPALRVAE